MKNKLLVFLFFIPSILYAQDDLLELLESQDSLDTEYIEATFKGTRLILGHSVKTRTKKQLEFLISHRFGRINSGAHNFWGLDDAQIRLGLEYGLTNRFNIGIGRSSFDKSYDGFLKYKLLRQSTGARSFPFTAVALTSMAIKTVPRADENPAIEFSNRLSYAAALLIARKFNENLSLQLMPTWVHKNFVEYDPINNYYPKNDVFAIGIGGRQKLTKSLALNLEYYYRLNEHENSPNHNSFSVGFDIETGGHVFQLHFTNSIMTLERSFITETNDDFWDGDIHFGFNISRTFHLGSKRTSW
ncbi:MAG: DUF5777 family beta-barrel protein [Candidatus Cyclobacteriaceae bacterium M2_1C_046]